MRVITGKARGVQLKTPDGMLTRPTADYSVGEILRLTEGSLAPVTCLETGQQCENAKNCRTLPLWQGLDRTIADYLGRYTLADLARMEKEP